MTAFRFFLLVFLFSFQAAAQDALYFGIHRQFEGTRAMGMGNAFTAVADDNTAIFYNPAGLSQLEKGESNWFLKADADPEIMDFYDDIDNAQDQPNSTDLIRSAIQNNYGETFSVRAPSLGWLWARPNWGVAVIPVDLSINMGLNRLVGPSVNLVAIQDTTVAFTYNWKLPIWRKTGSWNVGVTAKAIYRASVNTVVDVASIELKDKILDFDDGNEGLTIDADVGVLWKGPWQSFNPSAALVIRNALETGFISNFKLLSDKAGDEPEKLHRVIDLGYAQDLFKWWIWQSKVAFDVRDILHPNWNLRKGTHVGMEFMWDVASWFRGGWRVGLNQGFWTAGFTGELGVFKLDLASYGEDLGVDGEPAENRRYMMTMSLDF